MSFKYLATVLHMDNNGCLMTKETTQVDTHGFYLAPTHVLKSKTLKLPFICSVKYSNEK